MMPKQTTLSDFQAMQAEQAIPENGSSPSVVGPKHVLRVPSDAEFGEDDLFVSTALTARAEILAERHDELEHLTRGEYRVVYLWKKAGGKSKGRGVFGKTTKTSGALKLFAEATWVIWLAADHCRAVGYGDREIEALLFHEMLHTGVAEPDEETGRGGGPTMIPHDVEMFRAEVEVYGLWAPDLREVAPVFKRPGGQIGLFDPGDDEGEEIGLFDPGDDEGEEIGELLERQRQPENQAQDDEPEGDPLADVEPIV